MVNIEELKFDEKGLIPAIVVDAVTKEVLTLAYMNKESLQISMEKERTCFYSRSRQELWLKGETSGNYQHIVSITADCDYDALVVKVTKLGVHSFQFHHFVGHFNGMVSFFIDLIGCQLQQFLGAGIHTQAATLTVVGLKG